MAPLPDPATIAQPVGDCIGLEALVFEPGLLPILEASIEAFLGPVGLVLEGLQNLPTLPDVIAEISTDLIGILSLPFVNKQIPPIEVDFRGLTLELGNPSLPPLPELVIPEFASFVLGMFTIPFNLVTELISSIPPVPPTPDVVLSIVIDALSLPELELPDGSLFNVGELVAPCIAGSYTDVIASTFGG